LEKRMIIEGAIFDLDGTLLDSMCVWENLDVRYLESIGIEPSLDLQEEIRSASLRKAAEVFKHNYNLPATIDEIMDGINKLVEDMYFSIVQPKTGVCEFLEYLRSIGVKMCITTATDRYQVEAALSRCGLMHYFGKIFTCTEVGRGKDSPIIFEEALNFLGTDREKTVVFEDALHAIRTAKKAGLKVAAVEDRSAEKEKIEIYATSDIYLEDFRNAYRLFEEKSI